MHLNELAARAITAPAESAPRLLPMVSASIYCQGCVDSLLREVVIPFRKSMQEEFPDTSLWLLRYARRGQHLKVRLHLPAEAHPSIKTRLARSVGAYFAGLPAAVQSLPRNPFGELPPIDPEDEGAGLGEDRSLIFTTYEYRPEQVGNSPVFGFPGFDTLYFRGLAAASAATLDWLAALAAGGAAGDPSTKQRMGLALRILLAGVSGLDEDEGRQTRQLAFQRDWLLRLSPDRAEALELFERKIGGLSHAAETPVTPAPAGAGPALAAWSRAMAELGGFCRQETASGGPAAADPFGDPFHLAASRAIHNAINPVGIGLRNEAYLCHLAIALRAGGLRRKES